MSESQADAKDVVIMGPREVDAERVAAAAANRQRALDGARGLGVKEGLQRAEVLREQDRERHEAVLEALRSAHREEIVHLKKEWREHETEVRGAAYWRGAFTLGLAMSLMLGAAAFFYGQQVMAQAFDEAGRMDARRAAMESLVRDAGPIVSDDKGTARPDREPAGRR
jgi:hypothetical protein